MDRGINVEVAEFEAAGDCCYKCSIPASLHLGPSSMLQVTTNGDALHVFAQESAADDELTLWSSGPEHVYFTAAPGTVVWAATGAATGAAALAALKAVRSK